MDAFCPQFRFRQSRLWERNGFLPQRLQKRDGIISPVWISHFHDSVIQWWLEHSKEKEGSTLAMPPFFSLLEMLST